MPLAPATIEHGLRERINGVLDGGLVYLDTNKFEFKSLLREAEKLASAEPAAGSLLKAEIFQLAGDESNVRYWLGNARKLGLNFEADCSSVVMLSNLGHFTEAAGLYSSIVQEVSVVGRFLYMGTVLSAFNAMIAASHLVEQAKLEVEMEPGLSVAKTASAVLGRLCVSESSVQAMLDIAGEVLRRHRLLWSDTKPLIRLLNDEEDAAFLYQLHIPVPPETAYELTDEATALMIERDLTFPGVAFSFLSNQL